jgi:hypothetical protein
MADKKACVSPRASSSLELVMNRVMSQCKTRDICFYFLIDINFAIHDASMEKIKQFDILESSFLIKLLGLPTSTETRS